MREYGCIQARVGGIELTIDPSFQYVAPGTLEETPAKPAAVVTVSGDEKPASKINPLLRNKTLGLGPLLSAVGGEKHVAP